MKKSVIAIGSLICLGGLVGCQKPSDDLSITCEADICELSVYSGTTDGIIIPGQENMVNSIIMSKDDRKSIKYPEYDEMTGDYTKIVILSNYYETSNIKEYRCIKTMFILRNDKTYERFENDVDSVVSASILY